MKTIKDLNDKAWYRFLKVFYTVFFTIVAMVVVYITFEIVGAHEEDYSVTCNYGNKSKFLAYKDKKINVSYHFDYKSNSERLSDSSTADIVKACGISLKENEDILYYIYNGTFDGPRRFDLEKIKVTDLSDSLFLIPGFLIIFFYCRNSQKSFLLYSFRQSNTKEKLMSKKLFIYFILIIPFVLAVTSAYFYRAKVSDTKNIEITTVDKCYEFNLGMDKMSENVTSQEKRSCASLLIAEAGESVIEDKNVLDYKLSFQALEAISKKDFGNLKSFNRFSAIKDFNSCDKLSSNSAEYGCYLRLEEFLQNTFRSQIAQNIQLEKKATLAEDASIAMPKDQEALNEDLLSKENDWYDLYVKSIDRNQRLCYVYSRQDQGSAWYKAIAQCHIELISKDILFMNDFYTHYSSYYKNKYKDF